MKYVFTARVVIKAEATELDADDLCDLIHEELLELLGDCHIVMSVEESEE